MIKLFWKCTEQGCKFSDFSQIPDFFSQTPLRIIFESSSLEHILHTFRFSGKLLFHTFSLNLTYIPGRDHTT